LIVPSNVAQRYSYLLPYIQVVAQRVKETVFSYCEREGFAFIGRTKSVESLAEKIESGRFSKWSSLEDVYACAIVIPTLAREDDVIRFLQNAFAEVAIYRRHGSQKAPETFRFDTTRFIGRTRNLPSLNFPPEVFEIAFEVQIRSAFDHAWAVTTHNLVYKTESVDWKDRRLASQLRASTEQLDMIVLGFEQTSELVTTQEWPDLDLQRKIANAFKEQVNSGKIPQELAPRDWNRFAENLFVLIRSPEHHRNQPRDQLVRQALEILDGEIVRSSPAIFPRSVSLLQWCLGTLTAAGFLRHPLIKYVPNVTSELIALFPSVEQLTGDFEAGL